MQPTPAFRLTRRTTPHRTAVRAVINEPGISGISIVWLGIGAGLLLDFLIADVHPLFSVALSILSVPVALYWTLYRTQFMNDRRPPNTDYMRNLALATVAGQAGCTTVILVFLALFAGMYLDSRLDTHPVLTIGLILAAIPISLYSMIRLMLSSVAAIKHPSAANDPRAANDAQDAE